MMFMDAHDAYKNGDLKTALMKYYYLAELGYEVAQSNVAYILDKGRKANRYGCFQPIVFIFIFSSQLNIYLKLKV